MKRTRIKFTPKFKSNMAIEALKNDKVWLSRPLNLRFTRIKSPSGNVSFLITPIGLLTELTPVVRSHR